MHSVLLIALSKPLFDYLAVQIIATLVFAYAAKFIVHTIIDHIVSRVLKHHKFANSVDQKKRKQTLSVMFKTASTLIILVVAILVILTQLNIDIGALAAGAGLVGVIVGLGAQNVMKDILAGITIIAENQYRLGDIISLYADGKDVAGVVEDITVRVTRLRDLDGNRHIIPNGSISVMSNLSFHFANVNVDVGVSYDTDIDHVEKVMNTVGVELANDPQWKAHIFEPIQFFRLENFDDSAVRVKALGKVEPAQQWDVASEFRRRLKKAFEKEKIEIPFKQVVVRKPVKKS